MENLMQHIDYTISNLKNDVNEKITGTNYLENIKYPLIDKLKSINSSSLIIDSNILKKKYGSNNLTLSISKYSDTSSKIKNIIENDYLGIIISGAKSIEIFSSEDAKTSELFNLFSNTGLVISEKTIISECVSKNSILLDIYNIQDKADIEN